jgi:hypothetical protein
MRLVNVLSDSEFRNLRAALEKEARTKRWVLRTVTCLVMALAIGGAAAGYVAHQNGRGVFGPEMTGLILTKGGYRSWSVSWCDGKLFDGKKWRPVSFIGPERAFTGMRIGYRWPRYRHFDIRPLVESGVIGHE